MPNFNIRLKPESQKIIEGLAAAGKIDLRPVLNVIGVGYRKEVALIFSHQQERNEGLKWAPLSEQYAQWKEKHFPGQPILVRTGTLRSSMTELGAEGNITIISKTGAVFGSSISYGIYHDADGPRSGRLPRRNFSEPSEARRNIWIGQIEKSIINNFEKQGVTVKGSVLI